jgi:hypothetical protein
MLTGDTQDARYMNPTSDAQKQQLFFAPCKNLKTDDMMPAERLFDIENDEGTRAQAVCACVVSCRAPLITHRFAGIPDPVTGKVKKKRQIRISGFGLPAIGIPAHHASLHHFGT